MARTLISDVPRLKGQRTWNPRFCARTCPLFGKRWRVCFRFCCAFVYLSLRLSHDKAIDRKYLEKSCCRHFQEYVGCFHTCIVYRLHVVCFSLARLYMCLFFEKRSELLQARHSKSNSKKPPRLDLVITFTKVVCTESSVLRHVT